MVSSDTGMTPALTLASSTSRSHRGDEGDVESTRSPVLLSSKLQLTLAPFSNPQKILREIFPCKMTSDFFFDEIQIKP